MRMKQLSRNPSSPPSLWSSPGELKERILWSLSCPPSDLWGVTPNDTASVLLALHWDKRSHNGPVILLNKRSPSVKQPGDLCCPGGSVDRLKDTILGAILRCPGLSFKRSGGWRACRGRIAGSAMSTLCLFWAACLRESWEEMGLRPWKVEYLGVLEPYRLRMFQRRILPMVGWIDNQERFRPNWEVARIVPIAISALLDRGRYCRFRIRNHPRGSERPEENVFPCYIHEDEKGREVLWGATYNIVQSFLYKVMGFTSPEMDERPVVQGELAHDYLTGSRK